MVSITFSIETMVPVGYMVCLVGEFPELGSWDPLLAIPMMRDKTKQDVWKAKVKLQKNCVYHYRYFYCKPLWKSHQCGKTSISEITDLRDTLGISILSWESGLPRKIDTRGLPDGHELSPVTFGRRRHTIGEWSLGWLSDVADVRIRLCGEQPIWIKDVDQDKEDLVYVIKCFTAGYNELLPNSASLRASSSDSEPSNPMRALINACTLPVSAYMRTMHRSGSNLLEHGNRKTSAESWESETSQSREGCKYTEDDGSEPAYATEAIPIKMELVSPVKVSDEECIMFKNGEFLTFRSQTSFPKCLGFKLEITSMNKDGKKFGTVYAYLLPLADNTKKTKVFPLFNHLSETVGSLTINYLIIYPTPKLSLDMKISYQNHWALDSGTLTYGTGKPKDCTCLAKAIQRNNTIESVRENTLASIKTAAWLGVKIAEIHVQLCADKVPVVFADFHAVLIRNKRGSSQPDFYVAAIKDLTLEQLHDTRLKNISDTVSNTSQLSDGVINTQDLDPFPTLEKCLEDVDISLGLNIQVMYPQVLQDGRQEVTNYFSRNNVCDNILQTVFNEHRGRRIIFSSFHPDICTMLSNKQNRYPVLFMNHCATGCPLYKDVRTQSIDLSTKFAHSEHLLGIGVFAEDVFRDNTIPLKAQKLGLILAAWGSTKNRMSEHDKLRSLHVDMIITEDIEADKPPVFELKRTVSCMKLNLSDIVCDHPSYESFMTSARNSE